MLPFLSPGVVTVLSLIRGVCTLRGQIAARILQRKTNKQKTPTLKQNIQVLYVIRV